jgi:hypothetical protein
MPAFNLEATKPAVFALTTDNTQTVLGTFTTRSNKSYLARAFVLGHKTNDNNLVAGYILSAVFKNVGGTLSLVQSVVDTFGAASGGEDAGAAAWAATMDASSGAIRLLVTAANSISVTWGGKLEIMELGQIYANYGAVN